MTEASESAQQAGATPGAVLAAARRESGLTTADVAGQMRISLRQVEAIEADRYDELPGTVFVRGFVRNYARLLNLDPAPLLSALEPELGSDAPLRAQHYEGAMPDSRRGHARVWLALFLMVLAVVLGTAAYEYWRGRSAVKPDASSSEAPSVEGATAGTESPVVPGPVVEPVPLEPERVPDAPVAPTDAAVEVAPETATPAIEPAKAAEPKGMAELRVEFLRESWIEVREKAGRIVYSGTGGAGTSRTFEGTAPLEVVVGNASGVRITYNQQPVDVVARATRNIARFTLE